MFIDLRQLAAATLALASLASAAPLEERGLFGSASSSFVAQRQFTIPSVSGDRFSYQVSDSYRISGSCKHDHLKVSSHSDKGKLSDPDSPWVIHRDLPTICPIGKYFFWFFDDSFAYKSDGTFVGAASNSVVVSRDSSNPASVEEISIEHDGTVVVAIPWTDEEKETQYDDDRYALWAFGPCVPIDDSHASQVWSIVKFANSSYSETVGYTVADYSISDGALEVTRREVTSMTTTTYPYGAFASLLVNNVVYMYALDSTYSDKYDVHLASVPRATIYDTSTWSYYDGGSDSWSSSPPDATKRNKDKAVFTGEMPFSTGSMFYSKYHNAYVLVFFTNWADSKFYAITSQSPAGPWNTTATFLYETEAGSNGYNYGGQAAPVVEDGTTIGKKIVVSYTYQDNDSNWYGKAETVEFE
ncbi:hypothetical protein BZA70DRAFT_269209 [Myxozyma melibiosi]|uniref:DUF4185 domain-containing protein n=1 Tax=Myxozyma melibiosi TaxID=54550 RepID=A0ABR1F2Q9_9ASCO